MKSRYKLKTPLSYPGGKSKMATTLAKDFPSVGAFSTMKEYREPFMGGASMAFYMTQIYPHLNIWVNDIYPALYTFWITVRDDVESLITNLLWLRRNHHDKEVLRMLFNDMMEIITDMEEDNLTIATSFYMANKTSFSGLTQKGSFGYGKSTGFTEMQIERLREFSALMQNWKITNLSYEELSSDDPNVFIYYDPPYEIASSNLYGSKGELHKVFSHDDFAKEMNTHKSPAMISYNSSPEIMNRFPDWIQHSFKFGYVMCSNSKKYMEDQKDREEIILMNYKTI